MLIVMSDLHFAESASVRLGELQFNHNLPAGVYRSFFREIKELIREDDVNRVDLVLAGDIFEINRSALWLDSSLRPYVNNEEVGNTPELENMILSILEAIIRDHRVAETLSLFRRLSEFFGKPVQIHFIPGNHDRLLNSTAKIRHRVQSYLGLDHNDSPFKNQYLHYAEGEAMTLVRHGHEYDRANFSQSFVLADYIPTFIDKEAYDKPVVGDIVTVELASKLPKLFKDYYSEETILSIDELVMIYHRLIDFDNVRPATALMNFLFSTPGLSQKEVWRFIEPVVIRALDDAALDPVLGQNIINFGGIVGFTATLFNFVFKIRPWRKGIPFWLAKLLLKPASRGSKIDSSIPMVMKESFLRENASTIKCIVAGHTHNAVVELLKVENGKEVYYINDGTFRNVITTTPGLNQFGRIRSKARVLIFGPGERNPEYARETGWSFDVVAKYGFGSDPQSEISAD